MQRYILVPDPGVDLTHIFGCSCHPTSFATASFVADTKYREGQRRCVSSTLAPTSKAVYITPVSTATKPTGTKTNRSNQRTVSKQNYHHYYHLSVTIATMAQFLTTIIRFK